MADQISLPRDANNVPVIGGVSSADGKTVTTIYVNPLTHAVLINGGSATSSFQTDTFTATNNQTIFTASKTTVAYTLYLSLNGAIATPSSDYSVTGNVATLSSGVPSGTIVVWSYSTT